METTDRSLLLGFLHVGHVYSRPTAPKSRPQRAHVFSISTIGKYSTFTLLMPAKLGLLSWFAGHLANDDPDSCLPRGSRRREEFARVFHMPVYRKEGKQVRLVK